MPLTDRQAEILELIRSHMAEAGHPPTRAEIARQLGFKSANAADAHLRALARKGAIELVPGTSRGIRLIDTGLPLVGRVAAGHPILAEENIESRYPVEAGLFHPRADYLLRVQGLSMQGAGILDGDLLAVHRTSSAVNGQIVVARIENEVTVKRFQQRGHHMRLLPENPEFKPIEVDLRHDPLVIEGISVGLIRTSKPR